jgi:hypothetical protein
MSTYVAWILVLTFRVYMGQAPMVVDNIASLENCQALGHAIHQTDMRRGEAGSQFRCIAVRKVKP